MLRFSELQSTADIEATFPSTILGTSQRQYKVRVSGKMQLLQKNFEGNSPTQNKLTGQKQLQKRKEAALVTL